MIRELTIETKELKLSRELKRKVDMICRFASAKVIFTNGNIKSIKGTNIAYVRPPIARINNNDYLLFENYNNIFVNGYDEKIEFKDLETYLKAIKEFFRQILKIGNKESKQEVDCQITDYYDNNDFEKSDVYDVAVDTEKEE